MFPVAYTTHVIEEWPRFAAWAQRYASPMYSQHDYIAVHVAGIFTALVSAVVLQRWTGKVVLFMFFGFVFTPAVFFNIFFHAGATIVSGTYCPGLVTALTLYPVLYHFVTRAARREHLITNQLGWVVFILAGLVHVVDVGHNVFHAW